MADNATTTPLSGVDEALADLLLSETWSEYFGRFRHEAQLLDERVPRFRAALAALGHEYSEAEVRGALLRLAGLEAKATETLPDAEPAAAAAEEAVQDAVVETEPLGSSTPEAAPSEAAVEDAPRVMHIVTLLEELNNLGVQLRCGRHEDRLHATPRASLEDKHVAAIRAHKQDLIHLLRDYELQVSGVLQDERQVFEEFRRVKEAREEG